MLSCSEESRIRSETRIFSRYGNMPCLLLLSPEVSQLPPNVFPSLHLLLTIGITFMIIILIISFCYLESFASPPLSAGEKVMSQSTYCNRSLSTFPRFSPLLSPLLGMHSSLCWKCCSHGLVCLEDSYSSSRTQLRWPFIIKPSSPSFPLFPYHIIPFSVLSLQLA